MWLVCQVCAAFTTWRSDEEPGVVLAFLLLEVKFCRDYAKVSTLITRESGPLPVQKRGRKDTECGSKKKVAGPEDTHTPCSRHVGGSAEMVRSIVRLVLVDFITHAMLIRPGRSCLLNS